MKNNNYFSYFNFIRQPTTSTEFPIETCFIFGDLLWKKRFLTQVDYYPVIKAL